MGGQRLSTHLDPVQVVDREHCGFLIFEADETESLRLPRRLIPNQVDVYYLSVLREHRNHIALGQIIGQTPDEYPGAISVLIVP